MSFCVQRVHLDIQVGEHTNNYPEIAAKDKLTELQLRARQLLDQVEQIQKEQNYQRVRSFPEVCGEVVSWNGTGIRTFWGCAELVKRLNKPWLFVRVSGGGGRCQPVSAENLPAQPALLLTSPVSFRSIEKRDSA